MQLVHTAIRELSNTFSPVNSHDTLPRKICQGSGDLLWRCPDQGHETAEGETPIRSPY